MYRFLFLDMDLHFSLLEKVIWSVLVSIGFAVLFNTPRRALWVTGLLGGIGFGIKIILLEYVIPEQIILASFFGASAVGILGMYFAHIVHTPPIVFTIPAVINMIPGKLGYKFIIGIIKIVSFGKDSPVDFDYFLTVVNFGLKSAFIVLVLAFGVVFPLLVFNTRTVKENDLHKIINQKIIRRIKIIQYKRQKKT